MAAILVAMTDFDLSKTWGRLRWARERADFKSPRAAAREYGWNENTYKEHERVGGNRFNEATARKYARAFRVNWTWLILGVGEPTGKTASRPAAELPAPTPHNGDLVTIREIDVSGGLGGGGEAIVAYVPDQHGHWQPADGIRAEITVPFRWLRLLGLDPATTDLVRVQGDSMWPEIADGDWVFVDRRFHQLRADDVYLLWDGHGIVAKSLQIVRGSDPARVRIISTNPSYLTDEVPLADISIIGRVHARIGRIIRRE